MTKRYEMTLRHNDGSICTTHTDALSHVKATVDIYRDSKAEFSVRHYSDLYVISPYRVIAAGRTTLSGNYVATADWLCDAFMAR